MPHFLGLDCGGSTSRALIVDSSGTTLFEGRGGPANVSSTPVDELTRNLRQCLDGAPVVDVAAGCFAGLVSRQTASKAESVLRDLVSDAELTVRPDYEAALAATDVDIDVLVVAGTGSLVCSSKDGTLKKSGGGGPLLGDQGSAFDMGRNAIARLCVEDPSEPASREFWRLVESLFGTTDRGELVAAIYQSRSSTQDLAQLAKVVGKDYGDGVRYAVESVKQSLSSLAGLVVGHVSKYCATGPIVQVAVTGGLWDASPLFLHSFQGELNLYQESDQTADNCRQYHVKRQEAEPVIGAVRIAQRMFYGN